MTRFSTFVLAGAAVLAAGYAYAEDDSFETQQSIYDTVRRNSYHEWEYQGRAAADVPDDLQRGRRMSFPNATEGSRSGY